MPPRRQPRCGGLLDGPVLEGAAETARNGVNLPSLEKVGECHIGKGVAGALGRKHRANAASQRPRFCQNLDRPIRQRAAMLPLAFMRVAGTVQARVCRSISLQSASRTSPDSATINTRNSRASLVAVSAVDSLMALIAVAMSA